MLTIKAGFTGTQRGMTTGQLAAVRKWLEDHKPYEVYHGDCVGADEQFHHICFGMRIPIFIQPPDDPKKRAHCIGGYSFGMLPYRLRNQQIVNKTDVLLAVPKSWKEELRSGTWMTVRMARKAGKEVIIFWP